MKLSFAPLEGIGKFPLRTLHAKMFPGADCYYSPFIAPDSNGNCKKADLRDVLPENNEGCVLIPQILTNSSSAFISVSRELAAMGYRQVNLNAGCPSGTVVAKHKGAGLLADVQGLDRFLSEIFEHCDREISVKTRIGMEDSSEFEALLEVYAKYPLKELIIHLRTRSGMYKSNPEPAAFDLALSRCPFPLCYNGNIFTLADYNTALSRQPRIEHIMIGRGAITNPAIFRELRGGRALSLEELHAFHDAYLQLSLDSGLSEHFTLQRMKEHWAYMGCLFPEDKKLIKAVFKSRYLPDYMQAVSTLFHNAGFDPQAGFYM